MGSNFKASAVNMGKVSFDSTSTIKGMIFQFLVALERCFEMQEGQSVYIERFGDVSVIDKEDAIQIEFGNSITSMFKDSGLFNNLTEIIIPDSVTSIGEQAFYNCSSLTSITIPDSVTSIDGAAFSGCTSLKTAGSIGSDANIQIEFGSTITNFYQNSGLFDNLTEITIGEGRTNIGSSAFYHCTGLEKMDIPDSIDSIADNLFYYCTSLSDLSIPDSIVSIGSYAFSYCESLSHVTIPDSVTSIGSYAFLHCANLTQLELPNSIASIGFYAFSGCVSLRDVSYYGTTEQWNAVNLQSGNSALTATGFHCVGNISGICGADLTWELSMDQVLTIRGQGEMENYSYANTAPWYDSTKAYIRSIVIEDGVTSIGSGAFSACAELESVTIADSVTSIGDWAFEFCNRLTDIEIPDSVTSIGNGAFYVCTALEHIRFPHSVTAVGNFTSYFGGILTASFRFYKNFSKVCRCCIDLQAPLVHFSKAIFIPS